MEFTITSGQVLAICAFISALWGVWKIVKEIKKPNDDLHAAVEKHEALLNNDSVRLKEMEESNRMTLRCLDVILNHEITGNSIDKMKKMQDELHEYLIKK